MEIDDSKPWVESTEKNPKLGGVLEAIIELKNNQVNKDNDVQSQLDEIEINVNKEIASFKSNVSTALEKHTSKTGPVHGETKATIGLDKKENLAAKTPSKLQSEITAIKNDKEGTKTISKEWLTPETLNILLEESLGVDNSEYMRSGTIPISAGRILGKNLTNQIIKNNDSALPTKIPTGQVSYLFSTEVDYLMFAELGEGRVTDFSEGGNKAPIGTTRIDIKNGNILASRGQALSLNNVTTSDKFAQKVTGLGWGFGEANGNFYDSNFSKTIDTSVAASTNTTQEVEACLFDPTLVCKPDKVAYLRNFNLTKHNFNELFLNRNGNYPFNDATFLSNDNFICHIANVQLNKQNNIWGIVFDFVTGDVGIPDWLPDSVTKTTDKILSKIATYNVTKTTAAGSLTGYSGAKYFSRSSKDLPWGHTESNDFANASSVGPNYLSVWIPFNDFITGFNNLSSAVQTSFTDNVDIDLLKRACLAWNNSYVKSGFIRIPFYYEVPNTTKAWSTYLDFNFSIAVTNTGNNVTFSAFNFDSSQKPTINSNLDLTLAKATDANNGFTSWSKDVKENPIHPKVFKGCFLETGGHITAYVLGHRQYICHYKHDITSVRAWIVNNLKPTIKDEDIRILDVGMLPPNRFYSDNTRITPLVFNDSRITYLTRARDRLNKYNYGTFNLNSENFDLLSSRNSESSDITWLDRKSNKDIPILIDNSNLSSPGINTTALVFSEINGFVGYQDHGFTGTGFVPSGPTEIDSTLKKRIILESKIVNPYPIFFYFEQMLYWAIASRDGQKNSDGYDVCVGGLRVDLLAENGTYTIRSLPTVGTKAVWGKMYNDYPKGLIRGRESESFDDVFIVNKNGYDQTSKIFVNYPDLDGRYYSFDIVADDSGYKYPASLTLPILDLKKECGYGETSPYVFYGSYFSPFMLVDKFYLPSQDMFKLLKYDKNGESTVSDYYMGWKNEIPLYTVGENITINGQSLILKEGVNLPTDGSYDGKLFISYYNSVFALHTNKYNPLGYPTEPSNEILFAGFVKTIDNVTVLSYHAPRGFNDIAAQDFINSLFPVVDGKQMSLDSMGTTFPVFLGKLNSSPRQYFFKK